MGKALLRDGDVISGAVLSALGLYIFLQAHQWNYTGPDGPGPGFFPTWYGLGMIALSLVMVGQKIRKGTLASDGAVDWRAAGRGLGTWAAFTLSVALYKPLGFTVSFALLTCFIVAVIFRRPLLVAVLTAVGIAAAFWLTFALALDVALPTGLFGF
ncbi:MAG TPA: tripartite tricarboxylate transporter TctB family protein [Xanthobacteraceae bacterium]|jgi:putative tricarboxylic transport membrane protein|nr:tripartite tricarboxylate transporter TctB family protein [Xanthobacteraceae bacterium]